MCSGRPGRDTNGNGRARPLAEPASSRLMAQQLQLIELDHRRTSLVDRWLFTTAPPARAPERLCRLLSPASTVAPTAAHALMSAAGANR